MTGPPRRSVAAGGTVTLATNPACLNHRSDDDLRPTMPPVTRPGGAVRAVQGSEFSDVNRGSALRLVAGGRTHSD
jgi:hypothetical protein